MKEAAEESSLFTGEPIVTGITISVNILLPEKKLIKNSDYNPCDDMNCDENAICSVFNEKAFCYCNKGYVTIAENKCGGKYLFLSYQCQIKKEIFSF